MSLERFRRTKLVILSRFDRAYQAARAMADNHIGAVLVSDEQRLSGIVTDRDLALAVLGGDLDPKITPLSEVMSEDVVACDAGAKLSDAVRLMREHGIRRIPITENGRPVGLITFDDLVVDGSVAADDLRAIVEAQLEVEAPHKPAGLLHPEGPGRPERRAAGRTRALMRARARSEQTYNKLVNSVAAAAGIDAERAKRALTVGVGMLCRRLSPEEAHHLVAQLPRLMQPGLDRCFDGPDRSVTAGAVEKELGSVLGLDAAAARQVLKAVYEAVAANVTPGEIAEVRGQLPEDMRRLFPEAA
jgi:CBS domain-containing protein